MNSAAAIVLREHSHPNTSTTGHITQYVMSCDKNVLVLTVSTKLSCPRFENQFTDLDSELTAVANPRRSDYVCF